MKRQQASSINGCGVCAAAYQNAHGAHGVIMAGSVSEGVKKRSGNGGGGKAAKINRVMAKNVSVSAWHRRGSGAPEVKKRKRK